MAALRRTLRPLTRGRGLIYTAVVGSCVVHAAMLGLLDRVGSEHSLSDFDLAANISETTLELVPPPTRAPAPAPVPVPNPAPLPVAQPTPQPEPRPAPQRVAHSEFFAPLPEHNQSTPLSQGPPPDISLEEVKHNQSSQNSAQHNMSTPATISPPAPRAAPVSIAGVKVKRAARVTYAVDISGPMTTSIEYVKRELMESIGRLIPGQSFRIVLFNHPPGASAPVVLWFDSVGAFIPVNDAARQRAAAWIISNAVPLGRSVPLAGLRATLGGNVSTTGEDLLFFMTRSIVRSGSAWGEGKSATLQELEQLNPKDSSGRRPVVIKALQFIDPDPTGLLQTIGMLHGDGEGSYKVIMPQ